MGTIFPAVTLLTLALAPAPSSDRAPVTLRPHDTRPADVAAIKTLLATYTRSVTKGDEAAFESLLLSDDIPFTSIAELADGKAPRRGANTVRYAAFRDAIFRSGIKYQQHFSNVKIEQDGLLAHASLDFETVEPLHHRGAFGWKSLQLIKTDQGWKIASEFYTVQSLPPGSVE